MEIKKKQEYYNSVNSKIPEIGITDWAKIFYSLIIGFICGLAGALFRYSVDFISRITYLGAIGDASAFFNFPLWAILIFLPVSVFITSWIVYRWAPDAAGAGSDEYINAFHNKKGVIKPRVTIVKYISSAINLGCGISGGFEGPIVLIGSGIGSWIAQKIKRIRKDIHIYMVTGTAAGIGAVFLAPLGGALTAIELLYREDYETRALVPSLLASVTGYFTAIFLGVPGFAVKDFSYTFRGISEIPVYIIFTFICSGAGWLFVKMFDAVKKISDSENVPKYLYPVIGAFFAAIIGMIFPVVLGPRFSVLIEVFENYSGVWIIFLAMFAKMAATCFAIGSGGSGGIFGPSLIIGGFLGIGFSRLMILIGFPLPIPDQQSLMLVGMAGFFAAVAKAPFGSVIMVCEITGTFDLLPPLLIVCLTSIVMTRNFTIYKSQVLNKFHSPAYNFFKKFEKNEKENI